MSSTSTLREPWNSPFGMLRTPSIFKIRCCQAESSARNIEYWNISEHQNEPFSMDPVKGDVVFFVPMFGAKPSCGWGRLCGAF